MLAVFVVAGCGGGSDRPQQVGNQLATVSDNQLSTVAARCSDDFSPCQTVIATLVRPWLPTPRPDMAELEQRIKALALADPTVKAIIGASVEGTDYWVETIAEKFPVNGEDGGLVRLLFAATVTFSGQVTVATDPCSGSEDAHSIENVDPCQKVRREFRTVDRHLQTRDVILLVDVLTNRVYDIQGEGVDPTTVAEMIMRHVRESQTLTPAQTSPVRTPLQ